MGSDSLCYSTVERVLRPGEGPAELVAEFTRAIEKFFQAKIPDAEGLVGKYGDHKFFDMGQYAKIAALPKVSGFDFFAE